jgi:hypothetical protein
MWQPWNPTFVIAILSNGMLHTLIEAKKTVLIGKSSINGPFSIALLNDQRNPEGKGTFPRLYTHKIVLDPNLNVMSLRIHENHTDIRFICSNFNAKP